MNRIIIVEDDPGIREAVGFVFNPQQYEVTVLADGSSLLSGNFDPPDIFIIDKQLPGVDGIDLCRHLKQQELTRDIPVIIMSASTHAQKSAKLAGAAHFIEKPYTLNTIRETVSKYVN